MSYRKAASEMHTKYTEMYIKKGIPLEKASKKAYKRVSEVLETYLGTDKFQKIPDKIDDMRRDFGEIKQGVETEHKKGKINPQKRAQDLKQGWETVRKEYDAEKKKSIKFRKNY